MAVGYKWGGGDMGVCSHLGIWLLGTGGGGEEEEEEEEEEDRRRRKRRKEGRKRRNLQDTVSDAAQPVNKVHADASSPTWLRTQRYG